MDIKCSVGRKKFLLTVDAILTYKQEIILIKRKHPPYQNTWALPGGIVKMEETVEEAVKREVKEETGIECEIKKIIGVFSELNRDPRGRSVSICYHCKAKNQPLKKTDEASQIKTFSLNKLPKLAFDHSKIITTFQCEA